MGTSRNFLIGRVGSRLCALPLEAVIETMRPLRIAPLPGVVEGVLGVSMIRGLPTPVLDLAVLLGQRSPAPTRLVTIKAGDRVVAIALDEVVGLHDIDGGSLRAVPPLLDSASTSAIESIGAADSELLLVLRASRLAPADMSFVEPRT